MEPLFCLALIRPAVAQDPAHPSIPTAQGSTSQGTLPYAFTTGHPRQALQQVAREFVAGARFINDRVENPSSARLRALAAALDRLTRKPAVSPADVVDAVERRIGSDPASLVRKGTLDDAMAKLRDGLLAINQLPKDHDRPIGVLSNQLRDA
jgi:hypothetical protein